MNALSSWIELEWTLTYLANHIILEHNIMQNALHTRCEFKADCITLFLLDSIQMLCEVYHAMLSD